MGRLPAFAPRITTSREPSLEVADIPLCSGLQVCSPPRSFLPLRILPQGSRGFSIRAYRALLPPHAPDMLTVRTQVIDGTGTFTLSDSQPCRLLTLSARPSPFWCGVGVRIDSFEACSDFTRVAARWIAQPPKAAFVTRLRPGQLPNQVARQLPDQSTTLRVEPPSTSDTRIRGAHQNPSRPAS